MKYFLTVSEVINENVDGIGVSNIVTILQDGTGATIFRRGILRSTVAEELWGGLYTAWGYAIKQVEYLGETLDTIEE